MSHTFEQIYNVLDSKGYSINGGILRPLINANAKKRAVRSVTYSTNTDSNRTLVNITPEIARQLIEYDGKIAKQKELRTTPVLVDPDTNEVIWTPETEEIQLRSDMKVWKGMNILEAIVKQNQAIDVYVNILDDTRMSGDADDTYICTEIKNAVKALLEENGLTLPELDDSIWTSELPKKLPDFDINIREHDIVESFEEHPTIVVILGNSREASYPDRLVIVNKNSETGVVEEYACNVFPSVKDERPMGLMPGLYENVLSRAFDFKGLVQTLPVPIYYLCIVDNKIEKYEPTAYQFMRISFPVQEPRDGITPIGAEFDSEETEQKFIKALNLDSLQNDVTLILLTESDFEG